MFIYGGEQCSPAIPLVSWVGIVIDLLQYFLCLPFTDNLRF